MYPRSPLIGLLVTLTFFFVVVIPNSARAQWTETVLHAFLPGADGTLPASTLVFDSSGNFYGTTVTGGAANMGTVFELSPKSGGGWTENIIHSFVGDDGNGPEVGLIRDSAGNLYGTTISGGSHNGGVVFELSLVSGVWQETVLYSFTGGTDGGNPVSSLIVDSTGNLYGTTASGGAVSACYGAGCGTVFKLTPGSAGWSESVIYSFLGMPDGSNPRASLVLDGAGNLYGTTYQGGADGWGTVFELSPASGGSWNEKVLHNFGLQGNDGISPLSPVILGPGGKLYGTTSQGDSHRGGVVYELAQVSGSWQERIIYAFTGKSDGDAPEAGLIYHRGSLYGTCAGGGSLKGGAVFKLTKGLNNIWQETVLHSFGPGSSGYFLLAPLTSDAAGNLYGTAQFGGVSGFGTAFQLMADSGYAETVMHSFFGEPDGAEPEAGLTFDSSGNLYGTAYAGGAHNYGTVFQLTPHSGGWTTKVVHSFRGGKDGANPASQVIVDAAGSLYGAAPFGGTPGKCQTAGCGIVYELTNSGSGWAEAVLHTFAETPGDGVFPYANLVFDSAGNLYGTTYQGGSFGNGTVFELSRGSSGWTETILYSFTGGSDGSFPLANVIFDSAGNLYGAAQSGGDFGRGAVFRLTPSLGGGWSESVLYSFAAGSDGSAPNGGLVFDALGNLYGTTMEGGTGTGCLYGCGTIFQLSSLPSGGWAKSTLFNFEGTATGWFPASSLVIDSAGNLYGIAGLAFELSPSAGGTWTETILNSFTSVSGGSNPEGNVIFDKAGNLYGTTNGGGSGGLGVVFELTP